MKCKKFYSSGFKRILVAVSLSCLLAASWTIPSKAQNTTRITASSCTVERGTTASVAFTLSGNPGIWGLKLRISYNSSAMTLKSTSTGNVFDAGEFTMSENLNKNPYVIVATGSSLKNKTANGTIVTLNFAVNDNAELKEYPVSIEVAQLINVDSKKVDFSVGNGAVTVVNCIHAQKEWRVTTAAQCEKGGVETQTCKKCGATFGTRNTDTLGHRHTEVRGAVSATKTAEGYTGDTYCNDCSKLIRKGKTIAKLTDDTKTPVTDSSKDNTASKGDSSSESETNETKNTVKDNATVTNKPVTNKFDDQPAESSLGTDIIVITVIVLLAGTAGAFITIKRRRR